jgi:hypothetical protein
VLVTTLVGCPCSNAPRLRKRRKSKPSFPSGKSQASNCGPTSFLQSSVEVRERRSGLAQAHPTLGSSRPLIDRCSWLSQPASREDVRRLQRCLAPCSWPRTYCRQANHHVTTKWGFSGRDRSSRLAFPDCRNDGALFDVAGSHQHEGDGEALLALGASPPGANSAANGGYQGILRTVPDDRRWPPAAGLAS